MFALFFYSLAGATAASFSLILLICYLLPDLIALNFHSFYLLLVKGIYMVHQPVEQNVSAKVFDYLMNLNFNLPIRIFFKRNRFYYTIYFLPLSCPIISHFIMSLHVTTFPTIRPLYIFIYQQNHYVNISCIECIVCLF